MSKNEDRSPPVLGLVVAVLGVALATAVLQTSASPPEAALDGAPAAKADRAPRRALPTRTESSPSLEPREEEDDELAGVPVAVPVGPTQASDLGLGRFDLHCAVEPAHASGEGTLRFETWPGPTTYQLPGRSSTYESPRPKVRLEDGQLHVQLSILQSGVADHHLLHELELLVPGYLPTSIRLLGAGPSGPARCLDEPIQLEGGAHGVLGTVTTQSGVPVSGAVITGCGAQVLSDELGDYFLWPTVEGECALTARVSMGSVATAAPKQVTPDVARDTVVDFQLFTPSVPDVGARILEQDGLLYMEITDADSPWARKLGASPLRELVSVGGVDASELTRNELLEALHTLDEPVHIRHEMQSADGPRLLINTVVTEL